ncbi:hypothetical protein RM550_11975 [Streptomyces sp. DSM 41527]|uniref:Restriction endonuclease AspBHI N-terminal domain-containing protein n=2 Tax=Streptomyces mooreae TaxID=3075523 RepID=A0ABU2T5F7_9ACTN|nr:hypothetical protein [Streptomyces sp. DSM 41527]MDT0456444.1 hypothetical protein [Streptomyces sp. DSM 41527]
MDWHSGGVARSGMAYYYGDNRTPGRDLHNTPRAGNQLLRDAFAASHGTVAERAAGVPPFLLFEKAGTSGRSVRFRGLLAPGGPTLTSDDELAAIWRTTDDQRFQNYRARFTVLDHDRVSRKWLQHVLAGGDPLVGDCPPAWRRWVAGRTYSPLLAPFPVKFYCSHRANPSGAMNAVVSRSCFQPQFEQVRCRVRTA